MKAAEQLQSDLDTNTEESSATVQLTKHPTRSQRSLLLQTTLKPLRPHTVAPPKKPSPPGSIRLNVPSSARKKCSIKEVQRKEVWSYELLSKVFPADASGSQHHVYYFAGGSFQSVPSNAHWKTAAELSTRLNKNNNKLNVSVHMVSPPLAPSSPAKDSLRILRTWLEDVLKEAHNVGNTVALAGDSSGGNLAATLALGVSGGWSSTGGVADSYGSKAMHESQTVAENPESSEGRAAKAADLRASLDLARRQSKDAVNKATDFEDVIYKGRSPYVAALKKIFLICPALDMRKIHPDIEAVGKLDPLLTPEFTSKVAECWRGASQATSHPANWHAHKPLAANGDERMQDVMVASDPRLSPLLADLSVLHKCDIIVDGLIAGLDCLGPDAKEFVKALQRAEVKGEWELWTKMMHCWVLTWWGGFPEGNQALDWMVSRLQADDNRHE